MPQGIFVGYRGYEINNVAPLFPFGHGLSYTTFTYSEFNVTSTTADGTFTVNFKIKNTGTCAGKEAAQVYITDPHASLPRPVKELKGFVKVSLDIGQETDTQVQLDRSALSFWDSRKGAWVAEKGEFGVLVAASSTDIKWEGKVTLTETLVWNGL